MATKNSPTPRARGTRSSQGSTRKPEAARRAPARGRASGETLAHYVAVNGKVYVSLSEDGQAWRTFDRPVFEPRSAYFDDSPLSLVEPPLELPDGVLLVYATAHPLALGAALFDSHDPTKIIRRSERAFWSTDDDLLPLRVERLKDHLVIFFRTPTGDEIKTVIPLAEILGTQKAERTIRARPEPQLKRHVENPILTPQGHHDWESVAAFNPTALHLKDKVHILYRAVGADGISVVGYAASSDGLRIDERLPYPIFVPKSSFDLPINDPGVERYPSFSGGGFGGCEDPRAVEIGGRVYMTYTAFDGRHPPGVALTSIATDDFLAQRWKWQEPALISRPGEQHKNWVVFPKKIRGKFAVLHSISPKILIDYFDDLDFDGTKYIKSSFTSKTSHERWDDQPRGVGSPPVETPEGWLVFYHAMDSRDPNRYKVGALLLDRDDPTKVLHRSPGPVLEPDEVYENSGYKSGVVYACGAVTIGNTLYLYYGGADTVSCVASYPLDEFLMHIKKA